MRVPPQIGICSYITHFGHDVDWIIWSDHNCGKKSLLYNGVKIYAIREIQFLPKNPTFLEIFNKIPNIIIRAWFIVRIFNEGNYSLILVRDDAIDALTAYYIKKLYNVPFIFMLSNPLEQEWEYFKIIPKKPYILYYMAHKFLYILGRQLLRKADLIIPISKWLCSDLVAQGIPNDKIFPVSEGINTELFRYQDVRDITKTYNMDGSKVIIYVGTLSRGRNLEMLILAFSNVRALRDDLKLLIVGEGDDKENLRRISCELGIDDDVIFTGQASHTDVPRFIAASNIGISPIPPRSFFKISSPIKMFEYMAMAKPVIANEEILEHREVLELSGGGILVQFKPERFADAIIDLLDNPEKAAEMGQRGRNWILSNRTYELMARQLEIKLSDLNSL